MIKLDGAIRCVGNYADTQERWEIPFNPIGRINLPAGRRVNYILESFQGKLIIGIRYTVKAKGWVCPDTYDYNNQNTKVRLIDALKKMGFRKNQKVVLLVYEEIRTVEIEIQ